MEKEFDEKQAKECLSAAYSTPPRTRYDSPEYAQHRAENIKSTLSDLAYRFLVVDRLVEEEVELEVGVMRLPTGEIEAAIRAGEITIEEMGQHFAQRIAQLIQDRLN